MPAREPREVERRIHYLSIQQPCQGLIVWQVLSY